MGMKILFLTIDEQKVNLDTLLNAISGEFDCELIKLNRESSNNLKFFFKGIRTENYDRIVLFLRFRDIAKQKRALRKLKNLVIIEHDACQNYMADSPHFGRFSKLFRQLPNVRIIVSGRSVAEKLRIEGFDAIFVPKGYDHSCIFNSHDVRDIEIGFIGSLDSGAYSGRRDFLNRLSTDEPVRLLTTESGAEYNQMLNRIRYFASCDAGIGEYMIKNFEAMGAGCILFAFDQGEKENMALGFQHGNNVMLYDSVEAFQKNLRILRESPELANQIAINGEKLAAERFNFENIGKKVAEKIALPFP